VSGKGGHRAWGHIKRQRTKQASYQASFIGPDLRRHYAPHTFSARMNAEAWLVRERDYRDKCAGNGHQWKPPSERVQEKKAEILRFGDYGKRVIDQRKLSPRTRIEYDAKWSALIEPTFGNLAVSI
jgi:hypothetical protein